MLLVMALGQVTLDLDELRRAHGEPALLQPAQDLAGQLPLQRVRLDEDERALRHQAEKLEVLDGAR